MNKLLTLVASISLCAITSALHCAEEKPRFAWENQFRQEAAEASRLGLPNTSYVSGKQLPALTSEAIAKIQEYLKPVMKPVEIVNFESNSDITFEIFVSDPLTRGKLLTHFTLYKNPLMFSQIYELLRAEGMNTEESDLEYFGRRAKETGKYFEKTVDLPVAELTLVVVDHDNPKIIYGYINIHPQEMKDLKSIGVTVNRGVRFAYLLPGHSFETHISKNYHKIK